MIFFSSSLSLVNITLPILVVIVSSPRQYHFAYPCNNYLLLYLIVFYLSWFLCFSLSQSPAQLSLSLHLLMIFLSFYICLVDITSYILVTIVSSPRWYHFAQVCYNRLLLVLIIFSLCVSSSHFTDCFDSPFCNCWCTYPRLFTFSWSSSPHIFASSFYLSRRYHFIYPCQDCLFASLISLRLSLLQSSSTRANLGESDWG